MELGEKEKALLERVYKDDPGGREPRFTACQYLEAAGHHPTEEEEMVIAHELKDKGLATVKATEDRGHGRYLIALTAQGEELAEKHMKS